MFALISGQSPIAYRLSPIGPARASIQQVSRGSNILFIGQPFGEILGEGDAITETGGEFGEETRAGGRIQFIASKQCLQGDGGFVGRHLLTESSAQMRT